MNGKKIMLSTMFFFRPFKKKDAKEVLKEIQNENQVETDETMNEFNSLHPSRKVAARSDVKVWEYYQFDRCHIQNYKV